MGANPHANGGMLLRDLRMPDFRDYAVDVPAPGRRAASATRTSSAPSCATCDQSSTSRSHAESSASSAPMKRSPTAWRPSSKPPNGSGTPPPCPATNSSPPTGRVMEMLSEHQCEGWLEGYLLTGRHGLFNCYEAFIHIVDSMFNQHAKWLKVTLAPALAAEDRLAQLPAGLPRLAAGPQRLHPPGPRLHRPRRQQEGRDRPRLPAARRQLPALGDGPLPAQPPLRQRRGRRQAPRAAVADHGRRRQALHRGHRHLAVGQQRPGRRRPTWSWPAAATCRRWKRWPPSPSCASICPS